TIYWNGFFNLLKTFQNNNDCYEVLLLAPQTVLNLPKGNPSKRKRLKIFLESYSFIMQIIKQKNLLIREKEKFLKKYSEYFLLIEQFTDPLEKSIILFMLKYRFSSLLIKYISIYEQAKKYIQLNQFEKFILIPH